MIHADEELIISIAKACHRAHPGVRPENWRTYVRTVIRAINGQPTVNVPKRIAKERAE